MCYGVQQIIYDTVTSWLKLVLTTKLEQPGCVLGKNDRQGHLFAKVAGYLFDQVVPKYL